MKLHIKQLLLVILAMALVLSVFTGCASKNEAGTQSESEATTEQQASVDKADYEADIVVVGGGGTGLVAALTAAENGASVVLIEKMGYFGGATAMSSGKIPAADTKYQKELGYTDTAEALAKDILRAGEYTQNRALLDTAAAQATPILEWLEEQGVKWELETNNLYYGQTTYRIHVAEGKGAGIVEVLSNKVQSNDNITVLMETAGKDLVTDDAGRVVGVKADSKEQGELLIKGKSVILATSGFGANREMVEKYIPSIAKAYPLVAPGATGEGIEWGQKLGAATASMTAYQGYAPISAENKKSLGANLLNAGGILINQNTERFVDEYTGYSPLATAIVNQPDSIAYMIWDSQVTADNQGKVDEIETDGNLITADTAEELANKLGLDAEKLSKEFSLYQEGIAKGEDYMNRLKLPKSWQGPFYATKVTGDFRHTQGGLVIDPNTAQVLKEDGTPIAGLYAGGGVTEGFSTSGGAGYMAGNGLLQAFVYGHIAGEEAVKAAGATGTTINNTASQEASKNEEPVKTEPSDTVYKDGTYKGVGEGIHGEIAVTVEVKDGKIANIQIDSHSETKGVSDAAIADIPVRMVELNSADVEVVTGATMTSQGLVEAVKDALKAAQ